MRRLIEHMPQRETKLAFRVEPIRESIIRLDKAGKRRWDHFNDDALVSCVKWHCMEKKVTTRMQLKRTYHGAYCILLHRHLLDRIKLVMVKRACRSWAAMKEDELIRFAKERVIEAGVKSKEELEKTDAGLHAVLRRRGLIDRIGLPGSIRGIREWSGVSDDDLIAHCRLMVAEMGITGRRSLRKADGGLYAILGKRDLLERVGLPDKRGECRDWAGMKDNRLIEFAKNFIGHNGISGRRELQEKDGSLYGALWKRNLIGAVFSEIESAKRTDAVDGVLDALNSFGDEKEKG